MSTTSQQAAAIRPRQVERMRQHDRADGGAVATTRFQRLYGARGAARFTGLTGVTLDVTSPAEFAATLTETHVDGFALFSLSNSTEVELRVCGSGRGGATDRLLAATVSGGAGLVAGTDPAASADWWACPPGRMAVLADTGDRLAVRRGSEIVGVVVPDRLIGSGMPRRNAVLPDSPLASAVQAFLFSLLAHLVQDAGEGVSASVPLGALADLTRSLLADSWNRSGPDAREQEIRLQVAGLIEQRHREPDITVASIARELHLSRRQVYRYFEHTGIAGLLAERRVLTAKSLIEQFPALSLREVALGCGFRDVDRLRVHFKRQVGVTPRQFRDSIIVRVGGPEGAEADFSERRQRLQSAQIPSNAA
ncbi:AraC family transcriptional regulator [Microbacterium sp. ASV49]|uniref:AraC family transcriptional regulator n=1 Tax=Microbacterium candidum TaxID=3041922 RepID=A0ABT7MTF6_9MICO|nr:AraC family transcriptional regulator [Microbacterium sp. ASV49]MDL9977729.1 AraC family transcriptional regulator [Microbacterium sp. ASV49]